MMLFMALALAAAEPVAPPARVPVVDNRPEAFVAATAPADTPEDVAKDSARDLKDSHFYNKPGATRAEYDAAWQECRLIARGSRTPAGSYVVVYNPAVVSAAAAGVGGGIGALIGQAIVEGQLRRANRASCLLVRGWRRIDVDDAERARLATLSDNQRAEYFSTIVGAVEPKAARITTWTNSFAAPALAPETSQ